jgi:hypothetical protein
VHAKVRDRFPLLWLKECASPVFADFMTLLMSFSAIGKICRWQDLQWCKCCRGAEFAGVE